MKKDVHSLKYTVRAGWLFILPILVLITIFKWYGTAAAFFVSLQEYWILGARYVGLTHFEKVFRDPMVLICYRNVFYYAALHIGIVFIIPIFIAILLMEMRKGIIRIMMILWFIPVSSMAGVVLWKWFYAPNEGLFNGILTALGLPTLLWLDSPRTAMLCLVLPSLIMYGPGLIYLASLQSIPNELYEAAELEGAGFSQKIWHITLPRLRPVISVMLILAIISSMQIFNQPFVMTEGGPANATRTVVMYIYAKAFERLQFGYGTAMAVLLFFVLLVLIYLQRKYFKENLDV